MRSTRLFSFSFLCLTLLGSAAVSATTYYISPGGSDSATGLSEPSPFKTFRHAFASMAPGDELILLNGEYSGAAGTGIIEAYNSSTCPACGQPPSGTGPGGETVIRAKNPGSVTVNGRLRLGTKSASGKVQRVRIQGLLFEGGGQLYNTAYVTIKECGFHSVANGSGNTFSIGTNDHNYHNEYNLIEDSWIWGRNRLMGLNYRADSNIWRRVVIRGDGCNSSGCTGSGNPNVGFSVYNSSHVSVQNMIVLDRILGGGSPGADFPTAQHAPSSTVDEGAGEYLGPNEWLGCISLNSEDYGFWMEADRANDNTYKLVNIVSWNNRLGVNIAKTVYNTPANVVVMENVTAGKSFSSDNIRVAPESSGGTVRNLIAYDAARWNVNSKVKPSYANVYAAAGGAYNQTACSEGCRTLDPLNALPTPPLRHITRIESGSDLKGTGHGGGDYGANVVKRYGAEGSRHGDSGYNTLTSADLWPWPNEARIRAEMCQGVTRGFCDPQWESLTHYVWGQLGNPWPNDPPDPPGNTCLTASHPDAQWQNRSFTPQSGTFTAEADVTPSSSSVDAAVSLSSGAQTAWSGLAVTVLFHPDGTIQLRDGAVYTPGLLSYSGNTTYHIRLVVDVVSHTYSAYVTPAGGTEQVLATGVAFRSTQATVTSLDHWTLSADAGSLQACGFAISGRCLTATFPASQWRNRSFASQSGTFTAEVDVALSSSSVDAAVSLSSGAQTAWSGLAVTVLFHPDGTMQLRDGTVYTPGLLAYSGNTTYHIRLVVDVVSHTYSAYVTPAGGTEQVLATGVAFRSTQASVTSLDHWTLSADAGSIGACNFVP